MECCRLGVVSKRTSERQALVFSVCAAFTECASSNAAPTETRPFSSKRTVY